jgi:hypothetical protein
VAKSKDVDTSAEDTVTETAHPSFSVEVPKKKITFEQFVSLAKVKPQHINGFRASVYDPADPRTQEEWYALLRNY